MNERCGSRPSAFTYKTFLICNLFNINIMGSVNESVYIIFEKQPTLAHPDRKAYWAKTCEEKSADQNKGRGKKGCWAKIPRISNLIISGLVWKT